MRCIDCFGLVEVADVVVREVENDFPAEKENNLTFLFRIISLTHIRFLFIISKDINCYRFRHLLLLMLLTSPSFLQLLGILFLVVFNQAILASRASEAPRPAKQASVNGTPAAA